MKNHYLLLLLLAFGIQMAFAQVTPPMQPASGPGGSANYVHTSVTMHDYGTNKNGDGFWIFQPASPVPDSANVVIFCHGWGMTNPRYYGGFITHIVKQGNIVIYPRYQREWNTDNSTYSDTCARGIQRALDTLRYAAGFVKPRLNNFFILGHSMGGVLTANMTTRYQHYNLPKPLAAFSMQPGADIPTLLLPDYSGFPADVKYLIAVGDDDVIVDTTTGHKLFNQTVNVPTSHKNLVTHYADNRGTPPVLATHAEPGSKDDAYNTGETNIIIAVAPPVPADAVDFYCYWKLWDALVDCALNNQNCDVAFGDTPQQKGMGNWSDGTPVRPLRVLPQATGINDGLSHLSVAVFPNPVVSELFVEVNGWQQGALLYFEVMDLAGRVLLKEQVTGEWHKINAQLGAGLYIYRLATGDDRTAATGKIVAR